MGFRLCWIGRPFTKRQTYASKLPNSRCTGQKPARVGERGGYLEPIANNAGIGKQLFHLAAIIARDRHRVETIECLAIALSFPQNGLPTETRLRPFKQKEFEEQAIVVLRHSPFCVMIRDGQGTSRPGASFHLRTICIELKATNLNRPG